MCSKLTRKPTKYAKSETTHFTYMRARPTHLSVCSTHGIHRQQEVLHTVINDGTDRPASTRPCGQPKLCSTKHLPNLHNLWSCHTEVLRSEQCVTYGCETWSLRSKTADVWKQKCLREKETKVFENIILAYANFTIFIL